MKLADRLALWANHVANDEYELCIDAALLLDECEQALQEIADGETFDPQGVAVKVLTKLRANDS